MTTRDPWPDYATAEETQRRHFETLALRTTGEPAMPTGYAPCSCRDCMEIAIPTDDNAGLCHDCQEAGCEPSAETECSSPYAYGMTDDPNAERTTSP